MYVVPDGMKMRNVKNTPEVIINGESKRKHKPVSYKFVVEKVIVLIHLNPSPNLNHPCSFLVYYHLFVFY